MLILVTEGNTTLKYLNKKGIYPNEVYYNVHKLKDKAPYLTKEDKVLLIVNGLTDLTMLDIEFVQGVLSETDAEILFYSNIELNTKMKYTLYDGDLFQRVISKAIVVDEKVNIVTKIKRLLRIEEADIEYDYEVSTDTVLESLVGYDSCREPLIHHKPKRVIDDEDSLIDEILYVDVESLKEKTK